MITKLIQLTVITIIVSAKMDPICIKDAPAGVDPENCCKVPDVLDHATLEKCAFRIFDTKSTDIASEIINQRSGQCLFECIFKEHGIFKNNTVLTDVALNLLKEVINSDEEWMPIVANAISTCKTMAAAIPSKTVEEGPCSSEPAFYFGCFHTQLFKNCPNTKWSNSKDNLDKLRLKIVMIQYLFRLWLQPVKAKRRKMPNFDSCYQYGLTRHILRVRDISSVFEYIS